MFERLYVYYTNEIRVPVRRRSGFKHYSVKGLCTVLVNIVIMSIGAIFGDLSGYT